MNLSKPIDRSKWVPATTIYCPHCGNLFVITTPFTDDEYFGPTYHCRNCHYTFHLVMAPPERPEDLLAKVPTIEDRDNILLNVVNLWWEREGKSEDFKL